MIAEKLAFGFKAAAERYALAVRKEFGLAVGDPIDCLRLCDQMGIPVLSLNELAALGASARSIVCLLSADSPLSALTVCAGTRRVIVYNPRHPPGRRASSLAHELSHILLEHPLLPALGPGGCRRWDSTLEAEADWQAAALLVTREGALEWMSAGRSVEDGAAHFGVSTALFRWRVNQTGIPKQLAASETWRNRRHYA